MMNVAKIRKVIEGLADDTLARVYVRGPARDNYDFSLDGVEMLCGNLAIIVQSDDDDDFLDDEEDEFDPDEDEL